MRRIASILLLGLPVVACEDATAPAADAASLEIRPAFARTVEGASVEFHARFFDAGGTPLGDQPVEWSSLDDGIVAIDAGTAAAVVPGWARLVATATDDETLSDTALVAVGIAFTGVTAGDLYACGWTTAGAGWCWGEAFGGGFYEGTIGAGTGAGSPTPVQVTGGLEFSRIDGGETHTCGVANGMVYCWGYNRGGAFGFEGCGSNSCDEPIEMQLTGTFTDVSVPAFRDRTTCATGPAGLHCWGASSYGGMGVDPIPCSPYCSPRLVSTTLTEDVSMGRQHGCALDAAGRAHCWGDNQYGQLGLGSLEAPSECGFNATPCAPTPTPVATSARFARIESGTYFTCGLTSDGRVFCWGEYHAYTPVPGGENVPGPSVTDVSGDLRFTSIGAGWFHACGVADSGDLYCWGRAGWSYALGEPTLEYGALVAEPRLVPAGGTRFTAVDVGEEHTCAVAEDATIRCMGTGWGLGQGTYWLAAARPVAVAPPGPLPDELDLMP